MTTGTIMIFIGTGHIGGASVRAISRVPHITVATSLQTADLQQHAAWHILHAGMLQAGNPHALQPKPAHPVANSLHVRLSAAIPVVNSLYVQQSKATPIPVVSNRHAHRWQVPIPVASSRHARRWLAAPLAVSNRCVPMPVTSIPVVNSRHAQV